MTATSMKLAGQVMDSTARPMVAGKKSSPQFGESVREDVRCANPDV